MTQVSDIRGFVKALGGAKAVANAVGVKPAAVYMAILRENIPHRWRIRLLQEAHARQIEFDPTLLGIDPAQ